ncbi:hypothetical protein LTR04_000926 [Oleoguttula sp. CCFEE 6159]|nr:hypothetical protein LTR04_000926 [Oleoguttula sp. CCFEE 6159]
MRNLKNLYRSVIGIPPGGLPLTATAWDATSDSLICAFGPSKSSAVIELRRVNSDVYDLDESNVIASWDAPCPLPGLQLDKVLNLHFFADIATACLVLAGGDIVIVREEPLSGEDSIEIVGSVDAGITAASWSPDEELLAISTRASTLLFMTREFENVTNVAFTPEDIKASKHVSVGWGKAETQFKGKRAKALRDPTMPDHVDEGNLSSLDNGVTTISWRGDGAFLAVNTVENEQRRMIRVYSREGTLDSVSEPVDGLEGALSWRPAGNLIAGIQRLEERIDIVFFERNGLRHGQFSLRITPEDMKTFASVVELKWNSDSTVLAVCFLDKAQLWTMGNYHYYLKQEIRAGDKQSMESVVSSSWHPEKPLKLALSTKGALQRLEYVFAVAGGSNSSPYDYGTVAVIDGGTLKITPLRVANVPPPMALHEVACRHNIVDVAINCSSTLLAVLHDSSVAIYDFDPCSKPPKEPLFREDIFLPLHIDAWTRQIAFLGDSNIFVLTGISNNAMNSLYKMSLGVLREPVLVDQTPSTLLLSSTNHDRICIEEEAALPEARNGHGNSKSAFSVSELEMSKEQDDVQVAKRHVVSFARPCIQVEVWRSGDKGIAFGLTANGTLFANERSLVRNCTSLLLAPAHLIFTTAQHLLKFVHLTAVDDLEIPLDEPEKDERCRSIERGARLVTVMPTAYCLVLQMPRGNLETTYPRALVLAGIRRSIAARDYKTAFLACRKQRVDMNILHDHAPKQFMENVQLFVNRVKKVEHIDLFLSQLREEDVSETMYKETLLTRALPDEAEKVNGTQHHTHGTKLLGKVNRICDAFLAVLQARTSTNLQNTITAHVCKVPPDLDAGLTVIARLRGEHDELAEKAVEHICFLADTNKLYDHALGLYNLELSLLIAQQSQKDPREYMPYLQSLQEMSTLRKQFTIDDDLKRNAKALTHLHELAAFDELEQYVVKHELYSDALALYRYQTERYDEVMRLYAKFLSSRSKFKEAGIAYEYLSDYTSASEAYRAANLWREALSSATLVPLSAAEIAELALALADGLVESKDFFAAALIHLDYLADVETAVRTWCKGYFFAEALRVVGLRGRRNLLETVDAGLTEGSAVVTELLADCKSQLGAQVPRLRELRLKKADDPLAFLDGTTPTASGADIPDNISLAPTDTSTSGGTFMTRYTSRSSGSGTLSTTATRKTSKNRRREERKRARGKKGSVYEEEYLVNSTGRLVERVNSVGEEVARLVEGLMRRKMRERAAAVEAAMREVVGMCKGCLDEVFQVGESKMERENRDGAEGGVTEEGEGARPSGGDGVFWDAMEEGRRRREAPVVKAFEGLALLE